MFGRKVVLGCMAAFVTVALLVGQLVSQEPQEQQGERRSAGTERPARQRWDPEQMQKMMAERLKETLNVGDEEWKAVEPKLMKVLRLSRQAGAGGMGMRGFGMLFRGQGPGGERRGQRPDEGEGARAQTDVEKASEALQKTLDNKEAKPEEIKKNLTALREAREKAKQELAKAQQELCKELTARQEAQLVLMGLLN